jgi:hypothetical protein
MSNTYLHKRPERRGYEKVLYDQHVERVSAMKPVVDTSAPRQMPYNDRRERDRDYTNRMIDYGNKLMLERIATTIQHSKIDNKHDKHMYEYSKFKERLYNIVRQSRLEQITEENVKLLKRIQQVNPVYSVSQMEQEYKRNQEIMKQMCIYK